MFLSAISAICFAQAASAPVDVPKCHWAFPAVDKLFAEGLLKGYPAKQHPMLVLNSSVSFEKSKVESSLAAFRRIGLVTEDPHSSIRGAATFEPSRYEYAVLIHVAFANAKGRLDDRTETLTSRNDMVAQLPRIAEGISMLNKELTLLGADCNQLIAGLNRLYDSHCMYFLGDRS